MFSFLLLFGLVLYIGFQERKEAEYLSKIDDGTDYAVKEYNCTRGNYGGLVVNESQQLVREDGTVINGLYAAGLIASGMYLGD